MARKADGEMFVPEAEQPYKIPHNWRWARIGAVADLYTGNSINEKVKKQKYEGNPEGYLYIATKDIGFDSVINYETNIRIPERDSFKVAPANTALLCVEGGSAGRKIGFVNQAVCFVNKLCAFRTSTVHSKYVFYFLQTHCFESQFLAKKHGLIGGVPIKALSTSIIPIAPLAEQQRIVERIESLFTKLDAARENAQAVVDGFELRKAAILHRAFTGELTAQWREHNGISLDSWEKTTLSKVVGGFRYGTSEKSAYSYPGMPVLRIPNIGGDGIDFSDMKFLNSLEVESANQVNENDILIIRSNGSRDLVGKCALVPALSKPFAYASFLIKIVPSDRINPRFLLLYLNSANARAQMFFKAKSSAGIHNINSKELGAISISLPGLREQAKITEIAEDMLSKESQTVSAAQQVIDNIDAMKRAILGRAFRGELGTNDPSEAGAEFAVTVR